MRFALLATHQFAPGDDVRSRLADLWELTHQAEHAGFDGVFAMQHFVGNLVTPQTISMVGRLVEITTTMTVGTSIMILPAFHPVHLAEEFATLDHLSGGRVVLGVGAGYRRDEFRVLGIDKDGRFSQVAESIEVIRLLWTGEPIHHDGRHYQLHGDRIGIPPLTAGGPPIWLGGGGDTTIRRAARLADAWIAPGNAPQPDWYERATGIHNDELERVGKSVADRRRPIIVNLFCAESDQEAERRIRPFVEREYAAYTAYPQLAFQDEKFQFLWDHRFLIGAPDTLVRKIDLLRRRGFDYLIARMTWIGAPLHDVLRSLELIRTEVIPRCATHDVPPAG